MYSAGDSTKQVNEIKEMVVANLIFDGLLPKDCDWASYNVFVEARKGWFGKLVDKILKPTDEPGMVSFHRLQIPRPKVEKSDANN